MTKTCLKCGHENTDNAMFCLECGNSLESVNVDENSITNSNQINNEKSHNSINQLDGSGEVNCPLCGGLISPTAVKCRHCGNWVKKDQSNVNIGPYHKRPVVAALLSFFLGFLGQFYNGQILKGIVFVILFVIIGNLLTAYVPYPFNTIFYFLILAYGAFDAYRTAKYINENNGNYFYTKEGSV